MFYIVLLSCAQNLILHKYINENDHYI
jgi:hypothetical protein